MQDLIGIFIRASAAYIYALVLVRLAGKRGLGNLSPLDFIMSLIVGDLFDDMFWGMVPMANGFTALAAIFFIHSSFAFGVYCWRAFDRWVMGSRKEEIIQKGSPIQSALEKQCISQQDLEAELRMEGIQDIKTVEHAYIEASGHTSIIRTGPAKPVQKQDKDHLLELFK